MLCLKKTLLYRHYPTAGLTEGNSQLQRYSRSFDATALRLPWAAT
jgi:hypothetical protein